jgi:hypothetical protein
LPLFRKAWAGQESGRFSEEKRRKRLSKLLNGILNHPDPESPKNFAELF